MKKRPMDPNEPQHERGPEAILAVGSFLLFSSVVLLLLFVKVPTENKDYAFAVLVALIAITKDTFSRYFSATKGSQEQRKEAAQVARTLADTAATVAASAAGASPGGGTVLKVDPPAEITVSDPAPAAPEPPRHATGPQE